MAAGHFGKTSDIKTQFTVRDGTYRQASRPSFDRIPRSPSNALRIPPIRASFLNLKGAASSSSVQERILFNIGRDLFFYPFPGLDKVKKGAHSREISLAPLSKFFLFRILAYSRWT